MSIHPERSTAGMLLRLRSLLFVPGDRPERMEKALALGADALILDLEDAVDPADKEMARRAIAAMLARADRKLPLLVRVNDNGSDEQGPDIAAIALLRPDAYVLPKTESGRDIEQFRARLDRHGISDARILPITAETPDAFFGFQSYAAIKGSLAGLTWGAEDLSAALGMHEGRFPDGTLPAPLELARSLTLVASKSADIPAIETVFANFRDLDGLRRVAHRARSDGFTGMLAIHPAQVPVINEVFTPSAEDLARAREIVAIFSKSSGVGAVAFEGRMLDLPHLKKARQLLALVESE